jgi:hypothetical protein
MGGLLGTFGGTPVVTFGGELDLPFGGRLDFAVGGWLDFPFAMITPHLVTAGRLQ